MPDVIYIPLPEGNIILRNRRRILAQKFVDDGWILDSKATLKDLLGEKIEVLVLYKKEA